jgi:GNAT superfamily N-acetyltransferase
MVTITTGVLRDNALYQDIVDFILPKSTPEQYSAELMAYFAEQNAHFAVALDDGVVVGTSLNFELPADHYMLPRLADFLTAEGISNSDCLTAAAVFVDSNYSGQNIADRLTVAKSEQGITQGYTYAMAWGYEGQAIFDYNQRIGSLIDTGIDDDHGFRIYLRTLQNTINNLSG